MKWLVILVSLFLIGCGPYTIDDVFLVEVNEEPYKDNVTVDDPVVMDARVATMAEEFFTIIRQHGIAHPERMLKSISFDPNLPGMQIGFCQAFHRGRMGSVKTNWIVLDEAYWDSVDDVTRRVLVRHEMAHCVLGLEHVQDYDIMSPTLIDTTFEFFNLDTLTERLFQPGREIYFEIPDAARL
jgi:hypothetical protein